MNKPSKHRLKKKTQIEIKWRNRKKLTDGRNAGTAAFGTLSFKDLAYKWEWNESVFPDGKKTQHVSNTWKVYI